MDAPPRLRQRAALPRGVRRGRRAPRRLQGPGRPGQVPADQQGRPARELPVRHVRGAARAGRPGARLVRHHRPGHRGRVHPRRPGRMGKRDGPLHPGRRRASRAHPAQRLRLRAVHRGPRRALRGGEARLHGGPGVRRDDRAAGHPDPGLPPRHHHGHAVLHARHRGRNAAPGTGPGRVVAEVRHLRRGTVDERDAPRDGNPAGHRRHGHLRAVRGDGAGRRARMRRGQGRAAHLGGPLLPRGDRPAHRGNAARRRGRRTRLHLADQAGHAGTAPATSPACCPAPRGPCGGWKKSPAAPTT